MPPPAENASTPTDREVEGVAQDADLPDPTPWRLSCADAPGWDGFFDPQPVQAWAADVRESLAEGAAASSWPLTGTGLIVEHDDPEDAMLLLQRAAADAGVGFARVPAKAVNDCADALRAALSAHAPILAVLEAGPWLADDDVVAAMAAELRRGRARFNPARPVLLAICLPDAELLPDALRKVGSFDRSLTIHAPSPEFVGRRFLGMLGDGVADPAMQASPAKTGLVLLSEFADRDAQALAALQLRRLARRRSGRVTLEDLMQLSIRGLHELGSAKRRPAGESARRRTAYHEAGHACIAIIASGGSNVPDYASIVPARDFAGIVMESLAFHDAQEDFTFENLLLRTRIALAGRAGEEMIFGARLVSSGANSDLAHATRISFRMFAHSGFHPGMESGESSATNLAVLPRGDVDPVQYQRVNRAVRTFLARQYDHVLATLREHRSLVDEVASRLMWDPVIDQEEMRAIARRHGVRAD